MKVAGFKTSDGPICKEKTCFQGFIDVHAHFANFLHHKLSERHYYHLGRWCQKDHPNAEFRFLKGFGIQKKKSSTQQVGIFGTGFDDSVLGKKNAFPTK